MVKQFVESPSTRRQEVSFWHGAADLRCQRIGSRRGQADPEQTKLNKVALSVRALSLSIVTYGSDAAFCRDRPWPRAGAGRDDGVPLPSPARGARSGPAAVRRGAAVPGGEGTEGGHRHDRRCDNHQCAVFDQECRQGARSEMHQTKKGNQWYFGMKA